MINKKITTRDFAGGSFHRDNEGDCEEPRASNPGRATQGEQPRASNPGRATQGEQPRASNPGRATQGEQPRASNPGRATQGEQPRASNPGRATAKLVFTMNEWSRRLSILVILGTLGNCTLLVDNNLKMQS